MISSSRRRRILEELMCPIMGCGPDHEIAQDHGVSVDVVAQMRRDIRRDIRIHDLLSRAQYLASIVGWRGTTGNLILRVLDDAIARAERRSERSSTTVPHRWHQARERPTRPILVAGKITSQSGQTLKCPEGISEYEMVAVVRQPLGPT